MKSSSFKACCSHPYTSSATGTQILTKGKGKDIERYYACERMKSDYKSSFNDTGKTVYTSFVLLQKEVLAPMSNREPEFKLCLWIHTISPLLQSSRRFRELRFKSSLKLNKVSSDACHSQGLLHLSSTMMIVYNHWTGLVDWTGGLDWWTGLVDWTSRLVKSFSCLLMKTHL